MVDVNSQNNSVSINISSSGSSVNAKVTPDSAMYYSEKSREYAESDKIIDGKYYSSKYYANKSQTNADVAKTYATASENAYKSTQDMANSVLADIESVRAEAVESVTAIATTGVASVDEKVTTGIASVEAKSDEVLSTVNEGIAEINSTKTTAVNAVNTSKNEALNAINQTGVGNLANKDLSNLSAIGEARFASGLNDKITNCITEIPQRIKYTLESGTLTIKAGSVVIVPYGTEDLTSQYPKGNTFLNDNFKVYDAQFTDGKFFVWAEVVSDIVVSPTTAGTLTRFTTLNLTTNTVSSVIQTESGAATNTQSYTYNYTGYYNTSTNLVGYTNNSTTITYSDVRSLPFMSVIADGTYMYGSIDQVFYGMGYIGQHKWLDKGIKILCCNGRNEDGSLKNVEVVTNKVDVFTGGTAKTEYIDFYDATTNRVHRIAQVKNTLIANSLGELDGYASQYAIAYIVPENRLYWHAANEPWAQFVGACVGSHVNGDTAGTVSVIKQKLPFRAVDYNEAVVKSSLQECQVIVETYANGTSWYRVWSDGWKEQGGLSSNIGVDQTVTITLLKAFKNTNYSILCNWLPSGTYSIDDNPIPHTKTTTNFKIRGTGYGANDGYSLPAQWYACGF